MKVYVLQHVHELSDGREDVKLIGVYSSESAAQDAVTRLSGQPGFASATEGFHVDPYELDVDHWVDGYADANLERPGDKLSAAQASHHVG
jgi:hypothetical protein